MRLPAARKGKKTEGGKSDRMDRIGRMGGERGSGRGSAKEEKGKGGRKGGWVGKNGKTNSDLAKRGRLRHSANTVRGYGWDLKKCAQRKKT